MPVPASEERQRAIPASRLPDRALRAALSDLTREKLTACGYVPVGIDHYALPSDSLAMAAREGRLQRNFQGYVDVRLETIGIGVTAISDIGGAYLQNLTPIKQYCSLISSGHLATDKGLVRTHDDTVRRRVIMDIMCNGRASLAGMPQGYYATALERLQPLLNDGVVTVKGDTLSVTDKGQRFVRHVAMSFDAYLDKDANVTFSETV